MAASGHAHPMSTAATPHQTSPQAANDLVEAGLRATRLRQLLWLLIGSFTLMALINAYRQIWINVALEGLAVSGSASYSAISLFAGCGGSDLGLRFS